MKSTYDTLIIPCAKYFQIYGIGMLSSKWSIWKTFSLIFIQLLFILNSFLVSRRELNIGQDLYVFSCSLFYIFVSGLILIKVLFTLYYRKEITTIFKWIELCLTKVFKNQHLNKAWKDSYEPAVKYIVIITKLLAVVYIADLLLIFFVPPLISTDELPIGLEILWLNKSDSNFYLITFIFQFMWSTMMVASALVPESLIILVTLFARCRLQYVINLLALIDKPTEYEKNQLLDFIIEVHADALNEIRKIREVFKGSLLAQTIGSVLSQIFCFYILRLKFYLSIALVSQALSIQLFLHCYLGDLLFQVAEMIPIKIYDTNWYTLSIKEMKKLKLMLAQSQKSIYLSTGYRTLNLNTFVELTKLATQLCAVLNEVSNPGKN